MSNLDKDLGGAAVRGEAVAMVPKFAGQFDTFQEWVNKAKSRLASPEHRRAICVDAKGRRMTCGADFMKARDDGDFPVRYFWECELAPTAQWACPDCGNGQQFDHRGCIKPVSARAADAPSEPSELLTMAQVNAIRDTIKPGDGWDGDNWDFALANAVAAIVKSRAADALDSQPTETAADVRARIADAVTDNLRGLYYCGRVWSAWSVGTMGEDDFSPAEEDDDIIDNITDAVIATLAPASSQPTDGGVRNG